MTLKKEKNIGNFSNGCNFGFHEQKIKKLSSSLKNPQGAIFARVNYIGKLLFLLLSNSFQCQNKKRLSMSPFFFSLKLDKNMYKTLFT